MPVIAFVENSSLFGKALTRINLDPHSPGQPCFLYLYGDLQARCEAGFLPAGRRAGYGAGRYGTRLVRSHGDLGESQC